MRSVPLVGRLGLVLQLGCLACLLGGVARAAEIEATGPAECPDSAELGFRVERNVGVSLAQAPAVKFVVAMQRTTGAYAARLSATGEGDTQPKERALGGADCGELADAVVVAMTLALGEAAPAPAAAAPPAAAELSPAVEARASEAAPNAAAPDDPKPSETASPSGLQP